MINRSTVFIPVVSPSANSQMNSKSSSSERGHLIEVYADNYRTGDDLSDLPVQEIETLAQQARLDQKAVAKDWDRVAAPLRKNSPALYQSGALAANVLRKIRLKRPWFAFYQWFKPNSALESKRLHSVSSWGPTEGHSAELGLTLALATSISGQRDSVIVATGALSSTTGNSGTVFRSDDVPVHPVGSVQDKLDLIQTEINSGLFQEQRSLMIFTPRHCYIDGQEHEVMQLPQTRSLMNLGVKVYVVDWLSEALSALNANKTQYMASDRLLQAVLALTLLTMMVIASLLFWLNAHIPVEFVSVNPKSLAAEPFEVCPHGNQHYPLPIAKNLLVPGVPVSSVIGWKTVIGDTDSIDAQLNAQSWFQGYYLALVMISEYSDATFTSVKTGTSSESLRVVPGQFYEGWIKLNDRPETNALIILVDRQPIDSNRLREQFQQRFPLPSTSANYTAARDVNAAVNFIQSQTSGSLVFPFVSIAKNSTCMS